MTAEQKILEVLNDMNREGNANLHGFIILKALEELKSLVKQEAEQAWDAAIDYEEWSICAIDSNVPPDKETYLNQKYPLI